MKKLQKKEMKKIKGGLFSTCTVLCKREFNHCLNRGVPLTECAAGQSYCISCECNGIC
jgi:bacteriocin-like protein